MLLLLLMLLLQLLLQLLLLLLLVLLMLLLLQDLICADCGINVFSVDSGIILQVKY